MSNLSRSDQARMLRTAQECRNSSRNGESGSPRDRVAQMQAQVLIIAATQDIDRQVADGAEAAVIDQRLKGLDLQLIGQASQTTRPLARQILSWYGTHSLEQARLLVREAIAEHASAALFFGSGIVLTAGRWSSSATASRLLPTVEDRSLLRRNA